MSPQSENSSPLVVGLGEALFDCFGDRDVLGGAPLNFAVHAAQILAAGGGGAAVATRVGDDALGRRCLEELRARGVDVACCQVDLALPTGRVDVTQIGGQPSYAFAKESAWDHLAWDAALADLAATCTAVCFGTLGQRSAAARETIRRFLAAAPQAVRLCDLNLRPPYYDADVVSQSLQAASAVKCNREELAIVGELLGDPLTAFELADEFALEWIAITDGEQGTTLIVDGEVFKAADGDDLIAIGGVDDPRADSVGAGDACGAALVVGMLRGLPPLEAVRLANAAGAFVASQAGATPRLPRELVARFG